MNKCGKKRNLKYEIIASTPGLVPLKVYSMRKLQKFKAPYFSFL